MRGRLFGRGRRYEELAESIQEHLAEKVEELVEDGVPRAEAERRARVEFGNAVVVEERSREVWQWGWVERTWADVRFGWRQLLRSPGVTAAAVLTLVLGISANTAIFTLTWNVVLSGLPVPHPEQLVEYEMRKGQMSIGLSGPEYRALRERQKTSTDLLAWRNGEEMVRAAGVKRREPIELLSGNAARVLEIQPAVGRYFTEQEAQGGEGTPVLLSYHFWQSRFGGRQDVLGGEVVVDGNPATVVGVMPEGFAGLTANAQVAMFLPLSFGRLLYGKEFLTSPGYLSLYAMGRLRPGVTLAAAEAETRAIEPAVRKAADPSGRFLGQFFKDLQLAAKDGSGGMSRLKMVYGRPLLVLEMLAGFVLLLCCVNTALVMLARVSGRQQEYAVRSALGAGRKRLVRQVLVETALLTLPGLVGGVLLGWLGADLLVGMLGQTGSLTAMDVRPNAVIVGVNAGAALLVALGAGLWPALRAAGSDPATDLRAGGRNATAKHLGGWAVAMQVAVSVTLVCAAVLLGGTLTRLLMDHSGFEPRNAVVANLHLGALKLKTADELALTSRLLRTVRAKPGVTAAGYIGEPPMSGSMGASSMFSVDRDHAVHSDPNVFYMPATPGYFAGAGTRMVAGRSEASPAQGMGRCVLSEGMARFFFPHGDAVGELVYYSTTGKPDGTVTDAKDACQVTGVVEDAKFVSLRDPAPMMVYSMESPELPRKDYQSFGTLVVRGASEELAASAVRAAAKATMPADAEVTVTSFRRLEDESLSSELMLVSLSGTFALMALLLTGLGLYGVLMRAVTLRRREIGIRIALGAGPGRIAASLGRRTLMEVAMGAAAGVGLAMLAEKAVRRLLQMAHVGGPAELAASVAVVAAVAALATAVPVLRAARVDPMQELRAE